MRLFVHDILMFVVYKSFLLVSRHQQSWTTPKRFDCSTGFRFYHNCICVYLSVYISLYLSKCLFKCVCIFLLLYICGVYMSVVSFCGVYVFLCVMASIFVCDVFFVASICKFDLCVCKFDLCVCVRVTCFNRVCGFCVYSFTIF